MVNFLKVEEWPEDKIIPLSFSITPKMDGWRIRVHWENGKLRVFTRKGEITRELAGIQDLIPAKAKRMYYEAEMFLEETPAHKVVTAYKNYPEQLKFMLIGVLQINEVEVDELPASLLGHISLEEFPKFIPIDYLLTETVLTKEDLVKKARELNLEGFVVKQSLYYNWWKIKTTKTADVFVTGFKEGKGKYEGEVGALYVSVFKDKVQTEVASVSGMTDEIRIAINEEKDIGRVCEIEYDRIDKNRLRHPRFIRWRSDKKRRECTWEQFV